MRTNLEDEHRRLRYACSEAIKCLDDAAEGLRKALKDKALASETPRGVRATMEATVEAISESLHGISAACPADKPTVSAGRERPTRQQGQFLAFIREYTSRNSAGVAPSHAESCRLSTVFQPDATVSELHVDST